MLAIGVFAALSRLVDRSGDLFYRIQRGEVADENSRRGDQDRVGPLHLVRIETHLLVQAIFRWIIEGHTDRGNPTSEFRQQLQRLNSWRNDGTTVLCKTDKDELVLLQFFHARHHRRRDDGSGNLFCAERAGKDTGDRTIGGDGNREWHWSTGDSKLIHECAFRGIIDPSRNYSGFTRVGRNSALRLLIQ